MWDVKRSSRSARPPYELLDGRLPKEKAEELAQKLSVGTWTHDYPIGASEAKAMGLNVNTDMPTDILDLLSLYPQPTRTDSGGVEYLPGPRVGRQTSNGSRSAVSFANAEPGAPLLSLQAFLG